MYVQELQVKHDHGSINYSLITTKPSKLSFSCVLYKYICEWKYDE